MPKPLSQLPDFDKARMDSSLNRRGCLCFSNRAAVGSGAENIPITSRSDWIGAEEYKISANHTTEVWGKAEGYRLQATGRTGRGRETASELCCQAADSDARLRFRASCAAIVLALLSFFVPIPSPYPLTLSPFPWNPTLSLGFDSGCRRIRNCCSVRATMRPFFGLAIEPIAL